MRTITLIFSIITITALSSCNEKQDAEAMLENHVKRIHIYESIAGNHEFMNEFLLKMQENDYAIQMMRGNQKIMGNLMQGSGMQMMHEKGMMSKDCMESCKNMMGKKR